MRHTKELILVFRMYLLGGKRTIGCPYHQKGININAKGELAYCAPKSKIIGNAIEESSAIIYKDNLDEKKRILTEECNDCIHDYHSSITYKEQIEVYKDKFQKKFFKLYSVNKVFLHLSRFLKSPKLSSIKIQCVNCWLVWHRNSWR